MIKKKQALINAIHVEKALRQGSPVSTKYSKHNPCFISSIPSDDKNHVSLAHLLHDTLQAIQKEKIRIEALKLLFPPLTTVH